MRDDLTSHAGTHLVCQVQKSISTRHSRVLLTGAAIYQQQKVYLIRKHSKIPGEKESTIIMDKLPFAPHRESLMADLGIIQNSPNEKHLDRLIAEAGKIAKPRVMYKPAFISRLGDNFVVIGGYTFTSKILRHHLEKNSMAFPHIVTCGIELEEWSGGINDIFLNFCAEEIKAQALKSAMNSFQNHLRSCHPGKTSTMNPGSLPDWPLPEQKNLFALLGDPEKSIRVSLSAENLMTPVKSISGITFHSETGFVNCLLCSRENCPGRKTPYSEKESARYGINSDQ